MTDSHSPNEFADAGSIIKLHRLCKLLLYERIRITSGGVEFLHKGSIGRKKGRPGRARVCQFHPHGEVLFKRLIDERAYGYFDVVLCLEDLNSAVHVQVSLTFYQNFKFVVNHV